MPPARITTVFTKLPRAGEVKTRLCPPLAPEQAARFAEALLADTLARCVASPGARVELAVHPAGSEPWFRARFPEIASIRAQEGADLGERLARHFEGLFAREPGASAIVVGSDVPELAPERLVEAHAALEGGADLVLGPDAGGGYYLVGLRQPCAELFTRVAMSRADMYARTLELARSRGLSVVELAPGHDVDTPEDLRELHARARTSRGTHLLHVRRFFEALGAQGPSFTAVP